MIDPTKLTEYDASDARLEELLCFVLCAAGHNAMASARGLEKLLNEIAKLCHFNPIDYLVAPSRECYSPFAMLKRFCNLPNMYNPQGYLASLMKQCGIGCYTKKSQTLLDLAFSDLDLKTCTTEELEKIKGCGMKSSRLFILSTRRDARVAPLDVHVLRYLREQGIDAPKSTPSSKKKYLELEKVFLDLADRSGMTVAEFDLSLWNKYSGNLLEKV